MQTRGLIPESFIEAVIDKADLIHYASQTIVLKTSNNNSYKGLCPFHQEKTPSFHLHRDKQYYHCFGCSEHGNVISFIMKTKNLNFPETIKFLAEDLNLAMPNDTEESLPYKQAYQLLNSIQLEFTKALANNQKAMNYLISRGISKATIAKFGLGYSVNKFDFIDINLAKTLGIITFDSKLYFKNRITFPITNSTGKIVGFGGRVLDNSLPKYLNSKESFLFHKSKTLYGLFNARQSKKDYLIVVEGYLDVIVLSEHGVDNAVATLGTAITSNHINLLFKHSNKIAFCFDGDQAGAKAAWKTVTQILPIIADGKEIKFITLPSNEDPDSLIKTHGKDSWRKVFQGGQDLTEFFFQQLQLQLPIATISQKASFANQAKQLIATMKNSIVKQLMTQELERIIGTEISVKPKAKKMQQVKLAGLEHAIKILVHNPHLAKACKFDDFLKSLDQPLSNTLFELIKLCLARDFKSLASLVAATQEHKLASEINKYAQMPFENIEEHKLMDSLNSLVLKAELETISTNINNSYLELKPERLKSLLCRKAKIISLLNQLREINNV